MRRFLAGAAISAACWFYGQRRGLSRLRRVFMVYMIFEIISFYRQHRMKQRLDRDAHARPQFLSSPEYRDFIRDSIQREPDMSEFMRGAFLNSITTPSDLTASQAFSWACRVPFFHGSEGDLTPPQSEEVRALVETLEQRCRVRFVNTDGGDSCLSTSINAAGGATSKSMLHLNNNTTPTNEDE